jgi:hypothetical protein
MISTALGGWSVGLAPRQDALIEVWFASLLVGHLDTQTASFASAQAPPPQPATGRWADSATLRRPNGRDQSRGAGQPQPKV